MIRKRKQHIGSHTNHARPDEKMAGLHNLTTPQRQTLQKVAKGKRRQRDKGDKQ